MLILSVWLVPLILSMLDKKKNKKNLEIVFLVFPKTGLDITYKLSPLETISMKS